MMMVYWPCFTSFAIDSFFFSCYVPLIECIIDFLYLLFFPLNISSLIIHNMLFYSIFFHLLFLSLYGKILIGWNLVNDAATGLNLCWGSFYLFSWWWESISCLYCSISLCDLSSIIWLDDFSECLYFINWC